MRLINITNEKQRDAKVALEPFPYRQRTKLVMADGTEKQSVQFIKTTTSFEALISQHGSLDAVGEALISGDREIDFEQVGRFLHKTVKLYVHTNGDMAYMFNLVQTLFNKEGEEIERRNLSKQAANIASEIPIRWTGKQIPKDEAIRRFVFTRNYQLRHTSGLSYDFLFDMARQLHTQNTLLLVGGGKSGAEPIVLSLGGTPYRGFLEGRIEGEPAGTAYCLILHLSNMELKDI
ncbi:hypothetical protein TREPR_1848 [Treponema primitia ZAS-2]|uniref:Uncharacterized protein n=1 Tax=Treponema primitia (strain ATCC BAA-887 / DSM 12427 / ZAS-2) TaxID=545694 RepID=F5YL78_TREPZ|nr:hypothetical protein [Treponema primitia]AEF85609.1 hypothetical protein TREPR_1848 [Treponema primitia ZAS-2]